LYISVFFSMSSLESAGGLGEHPLRSKIAAQTDLILKWLR
jgi:hypothetical protein